jgi:hypothetical protein
VEDVNDRLYVAFGSLAPPFGGVVDVFDTDGHLLTPNHFAANAPGAGPLQNPWAIVQAPAHFGAFSNDLLIGNVEGAGNINAFNPDTGAYLGQLRHPDGTPIAIAGLWDLTFASGTPDSGKRNQLFFDAGPNSPNPAGNGLFGVIHPAGDESGNADDFGDALADSANRQSNAAASGVAVVGGQQNQTVIFVAAGPVPQRDQPLGPHLSATVQPNRPAAVPVRPGGKAAHARLLDAVFAGLDAGFQLDEYIL